MLGHPRSLVLDPGMLTLGQRCTTWYAPGTAQSLRDTLPQRPSDMKSGTGSCHGSSRLTASDVTERSHRTNFKTVQVTPPAPHLLPQPGSHRAAHRS
ncbi:hypothetical protein GCM10009848_21890 [Micromonospora lupini]